MKANAKFVLLPYQVIAEINHDHQVYLVQHKDSKKIFVMKTLEHYNTAVYKYLQENPTSGLPHIYEVVKDDNLLYVIEEYISGNTLQECIDTYGPLDTYLVCSYVVQLCDILSTLHSLNPPVIHRDIKPSNIILTPSGQIVLIDLNAAKYVNANKSEDTTLIGTKGYAAPEQYGFGSSNIKTDIYAVGILMNTLLKGTYSASVTNISPVYSKIITKATNLDPRNRYNSILELKDAILSTLPNAVRHTSAYGWKKFLPIGYRSLNPFRMILSTSIYGMLAWVCFSMDVKNATPITLWLERITSFLCFVSCILFSSNYLGVYNTLPLCRDKNRIVRIIGIVIFDIIIVVSLVSIMLVFETGLRQL